MGKKIALTGGTVLTDGTHIVQVLVPPMKSKRAVPLMAGPIIVRVNPIIVHVKTRPVDYDVILWEASPPMMPRDLEADEPIIVERASQ